MVLTIVLYRDQVLLTPTDIEKVSILGAETIHCGFHLIPYIVETVLTTLPSSTYILFTDSHLAPLYLDSFEQAFAAAISAQKGDTPPRWITKVIAPGEQSKSRETKAELEDFMLSHRCTRDTVVLALGGGVVGDLVGFVSANFMRGVRYCQIPTTLLAMVDSAVGGKVGSLQLHLPAVLIADPNCISRLLLIHLWVRILLELSTSLPMSSSTPLSWRRCLDVNLSTEWQKWSR